MSDRMSNGNDDEVTNDGTADPAPKVTETSTHPRDRVIPSSYGESGGLVGDDVPEEDLPVR